MNKKAKIIGTGSYLPEDILTNKDLEKMIDTSDEWILTRSGIKERRIAKKDESTSDLGYKASVEALKDANLQGEDIDLIIVATLTPDYLCPSTACLIQNKLNATKAAAVDCQAACSGYIYGLSIAKAFVEQKTYKNVLVIASEKLSSVVNYKDRSTCILFGDGAAACVVSLEGKGFDIQNIILGADGKNAELLTIPAGGSKNKATHETVDKDMHYIQMNGNEIFKHAVRRMEAASKKCLENVQMKQEDISWLIPHQANDRIIVVMAKKFAKLSKQKVYREGGEKYGNTSASSVGIALDELNKNGKIKDKENILFTAFGGGLTWGAAIITKNEGNDA